MALGHEHRLCLYKTHDHVKFARCIGHGGVPVYQFLGEKDANPAQLAWEFRDNFRTTVNLEPWALFGFAVAYFTGDQIEMRYVHENAVIDPVTREPAAHKSETIA